MTTAVSEKKKKRRRLNGILIPLLSALLLTIAGIPFMTTKNYIPQNAVESTIEEWRVSRIAYIDSNIQDSVKVINVHKNMPPKMSGTDRNKKSSSSGGGSSSSSSKQIPIVIISSLRPSYLSQVLESLIDQNPNTPGWILDSPRYLFAHKHILNDIDNRWKETLQLATKHNLSTVHVFDELYVGSQPPPNPTLAYHAKYTWYHMMEYLFHTLLLNNPNIDVITEALILEDDAVLAYDGLMVAAALFEEKSRRQQQQQQQHEAKRQQRVNNVTTSSDPDEVVHNIVLGGWSGENRINGNPDTYLAARSMHFQAMAYSMSRTLYDEIHREFLLKENVEPLVADWSEEITLRNFLTNYTVLTPSVGRMYHIGVQGMGDQGNGNKARIQFPRGWDPWIDTISDSNRTISDMHLDPPEITDMYGFVCKPIQADCGMQNKYPGYMRFKAFNVNRYVASGKKKGSTGKRISNKVK